MPARRPAPDQLRRARTVCRGSGLARVFAATTVAALFLSLAPIQAGAAGNGVDTATYIHSVCTTLSSYKTQLASLEASSGLSSATTLTQARDRLVAFLSQVSSATSSVATHLRTAGAPNFKNGDKVAALIVREISALGDAFTKATNDAQALSTSDATAFKRGADAIGRNVTAAGKKAGRVLADAKKRYNTKVLKAAQTKDPSCQGLK